MTDSYMGVSINLVIKGSFTDLETAQASGNVIEVFKLIIHTKLTSASESNLTIKITKA